jgi:hypothetical protein
MTQIKRRVEQLSTFLLGVTVLLVSHQIDGWWLDSRAGVLRVGGLLFLAGLFVAMWRYRTAIYAGIALWAGAVVGMAVVLFTIGPGDIWPIVLVVGSAISAAAVLAGVVMGRTVRRFAPGSR